jgi:hypothetical protein
MAVRRVTSLARIVRMTSSRLATDSSSNDVSMPVKAM